MVIVVRRRVAAEKTGVLSGSVIHDDTYNGGCSSDHGPGWTLAANFAATLLPPYQASALSIRPQSSAGGVPAKNWLGR